MQRAEFYQPAFAGSLAGSCTAIKTMFDGAL